MCRQYLEFISADFGLLSSLQAKKKRDLFEMIDNDDDDEAAMFDVYCK